MKERRFPVLLLCAALLLSGCAGATAPTGPARYEASYFDLFDTVTTIRGYAGSAAEFDAAAQTLYDELLEYHRLFDIYGQYEGMNNLKTVNDNAGGAAVQVDLKLIGLLLFSRDLYEMTEGSVDVTLGPVLSLWHTAREAGLADPEHARTPDPGALAEAYAHTGFDKVEIDVDACTVRLTDPLARLDVGAVAKGYAAERVSANAPERYLISLGGNVRATSAKPDGTPWVVGIQEPDGGAADFLHTVNLSVGSVVTSGDYQRCYTVDGVRYHHIIDPQTLYPAARWRSVTILCEDSGLADGLSTALFILDREAGEALLRANGAEAMWLDTTGNRFYSDGFRERIKT